MESKRRIITITIISLMIFILLAAILVSVFMVPKEVQVPKPWWDQGEKIEIVLEDERSLEKKYAFINPTRDISTVKFTYIKKNEEKEYIPNFRILYDGTEKEISTIFYNREKYDKNDKRYYSVSEIRYLGTYRVTIAYYIMDNVYKYPLGYVYIDIYIYEE